MQAFARIGSPSGSSSTGGFNISGYSFSNTGYGYDGFIERPQTGANGADGQDGADRPQQQQQQARGPQQPVRSQAVEDMYAVPENYLEIEGEGLRRPSLARAGALMTESPAFTRWLHSASVSARSQDAR